MCGIFALLNDDHRYLTRQYVTEQFEKGKGRGPEFSALKSVMLKALFGFHRLSINGLNPESHQPLFLGEMALICNGEIYNYKELYKMMGVVPNTGSDCEVILHLYLKYGMEQTLQLLDGVFAFILVDYRISSEIAKMYIARDPYGVRPLYVMKNEQKTRQGDKNTLYGFASELKMLSDICNVTNVEMKKTVNTRLRYRIQNDISSNLDENDAYTEHTIEQFQPGSYSLYELGFKVYSFWEPKKENVRYHSTGFQSVIPRDDPAFELPVVLQNIKSYLTAAVHKRCSTTERPIACLLSGGLDSSLIAALVNEYHVARGLPTLETYSIGLAGSEDLKYARIVADHLGTKHTEIVLTEEDFLNAIPNVIQAIESYDTTSVRASIGNWKLGEYISKNSEAKVIFNGDGSDELCGGYLYMHKAPDSLEFDRECRRLLSDIYLYDVLRSDKSISSHGLEPRTPFLDRAWVQYYLSIPIQLRDHRANKQCEKFLLRSAFDGGDKPLLPAEVLWRRKEAFSDGVSKTSRSLYEIIQEYADARFIQDDFREYKIGVRVEDTIESIVLLNDKMHGVKDHLMPITTEQYYYRKIFEQYYPGMGKIVPYFWMPKYVNAKDASARTLEIYSGEPTVPPDAPSLS
jgi:asparagine synthase (glutamine-hydrolysing)